MQETGELFDLAGAERLLVVDVRAAATFEAGTLRALFGTRLRAPGVTLVHTCGVSPDGRRFLINTQVGGGVADARVGVGELAFARGKTGLRLNPDPDPVPALIDPVVPPP